MHKWSIADRFFLINLKDKKYWNYPVFGLSKIFKWSEIYFHIDGPINFTYNHTFDKSQNKWTTFYYASNITLSSGRWYIFGMAAPTEKCSIEISINKTNAKIEGIKEGSTSFLLENEDFNARLNLKSVPLTIINHGIRIIHINNTFIGFIYAPTNNGIAYTRYFTPEGITKKSLSWDIFNRFFCSRNSDFTPIFEPIWGGSGTWTFYVDMVGIGLSTINILGADVELP